MKSSGRLVGVLAQKLAGLSIAPGQHVSVTIEVATAEGPQRVTSTWRVTNIVADRSVHGDSVTVAIIEDVKSLPMLMVRE